MPREIVLPRVVAVCMNQRHAKRDITITEKINIEIPDEEADTLITVEDCVNLIADHPHAV